MATLRASSSEESLSKDWTVVDENGTIQTGNKQFTGETMETLGDGHSSTTSLSESDGQLVDVDKVVTGDSDVDFVRVDSPDCDDYMVVDSNRIPTTPLETSRTSNLDDEDLSSDVTEVDSDDETSLNSDDGSEELIDGSETDESSENIHDELPDDYPSLIPRRLSHVRNDNINDWLSAVLFVVVIMVSGMAVVHFFGLERVTPSTSHQHEIPSGRPWNEHRHSVLERPPTVVLSDVQKGQVEILKQLQEMMRSQSDLKQRIALLEDENRDLRLRLMESRKKCTRILHKSPTPSVYHYPSPDAALNLSDYHDGSDTDNVEMELLPQMDKLSQIIMPQIPEISKEPRPVLRPSNVLPLTIVDVINPVPVHREVSPVAVPPLQVPQSPAEESAGISLDKYSPFFYHPLIEFNEAFTEAPEITIEKEYQPDFIMNDDLVVPLKDLISQRKASVLVNAAPKSAANAVIIREPEEVIPALVMTENLVFPFLNLSDIIEKRNKKMGKKPAKIPKSFDMEDQKPKSPTNKLKNHIDNHRRKIEENRRKFDEEYAEFKLRWKNYSRDNYDRKESKNNEQKNSCSKKRSEKCDEDYCYMGSKKSEKYQKNEKKQKPGHFWDSLPPVIRRHFDKTAKIQRVLKHLGNDIVQSKVFQRVVEEVPKKIRMSAEWWDCQWNWWQNYARNRAVSSYGDCAGYLTSWQNRHKQDVEKKSREECKISSKRKNESQKISKNKYVEGETENSDEEKNWFLKRKFLREEERITKDWTFLRATQRQQRRNHQRSSQFYRNANSSWWFFARARDRRDHRLRTQTGGYHDGILDALPGDPIYAFLKHRAMWHGSGGMMHHHP